MQLPNFSKQTPLNFAISFKSPIILSNKELSLAAAKGVENAVKKHLRVRNRNHPWKKGWKRSNYWAKAAEATHVYHTGTDSCIVSIEKEGVCLKFHGGVIRPRKAKSLAIPLRPEVADISPSEYTGVNKDSMFKIKRLGGKALLAVLVNKKRRKKVARGFRVLWMLTKSVTIIEDPSVIPTKENMVAAAVKAIRMANAPFQQNQ